MHNVNHSTRSTLGLAGLCSAAAWLSLSTASAFAAAPGPNSEAQARYEQDRAVCLSGKSNQDQATCLKEAGAARDAARKGELNDGDTKYRKNAKERCDVLTGDDKRDCLARVKGLGTTSGSVRDGGVLRETKSYEVKPVDTAASAAPAR